MSNRCQFVDYLDIGFLQLGQQGCGACSRGLHDPDTFLTKHIAKLLGPLENAEFRNHGKIDTKRLVRKCSCQPYFLAQILRCFQGFGGDESDASGISDFSYKGSTAEPLHATAQNGIFDSEHFRYSCFEHMFSPISWVF